MAVPGSKASSLIPKSIYLTTVENEKLTKVSEEHQNCCTVIYFPKKKNTSCLLHGLLKH